MPWDQDLDQNSPAYGIASSQTRFNRVVAGPGTGKSFALKRRVARIANYSHLPNSIRMRKPEVVSESIRAELNHSPRTPAGACGVARGNEKGCPYATFGDCSNRSRSRFNRSNISSRFPISSLISAATSLLGPVTDPPSSAWKGGLER